MSTIASFFRKSLLLALVAALGLSALPWVGAYAQGATPPVTPVPGQPAASRLQAVWAREQTIYAHIGKLLDRADRLVPRIQAGIDRAKAKGQDVSAVQSALDAFSAALKDVHPIYESMNGIFASHQGFDSAGNVTDAAQALQTVKDVRSKLLAIRDTGVRDAAKVLRQAIQAFRQANPTPTPTPSASSSLTAPCI